MHKNRNDQQLIGNQTLDTPILTHLDQNQQSIQEVLGNPPDLTFRKLTTGSKETLILLVEMEGMIDIESIQTSIIKPLINANAPIDTLTGLEAILYVSNVRRATHMNDLMDALLRGNLILLMDEQSEFLIINIQAFETRSIEEPMSEPTVRGPREGFTELLGTNLSMMRRRFPQPKMQFEILYTGTLTRSKICILYIKDIVEPSLVDELRNRLQNIKTESILGSGYIEQYIDDEPQSLFATIGNTEKPDKLLAKMLEGRVGIIVDGSPTALWVPYIFIEGFQSVEDYYSLPYYSSFIRIVRFLSFWTSVALPAFYVATINFHKEIIPSSLLASIAAELEGVPFSLAMEVILMILLFEVIREAGVRMPRAIGQAVSIVGALIIGDAAVKAGIVGTPTIIVVAMAGITTFVVTPFTDAVSILRILLIIPASVLGLFGLLMGIMSMLAHIASLKSFGTPYLAPFGPIFFRDWKDTFIRVHMRQMDRVPESIPQQRNIRHQKP